MGQPGWACVCGHASPVLPLEGAGHVGIVSVRLAILTRPPPRCQSGRCHTGAGRAGPGGGGGFNRANDRVAAALQVHHNLGFAAFPRSLLGGSCLLRRGWPHMASTLNPDPGQGSRDHPRCPSWALNHDSDGPRAITGGCCVHHCPLHMPHRPTPIEPHWSTNRAADWLGCYSQSRNVGVTRRQSMERWQH